jgi:hypothetical protein
MTQSVTCISDGTNVTDPDQLEEKKPNLRKSRTFEFASQNKFGNCQLATLYPFVFRTKFILPTENQKGVLWIRDVYPCWNPDPGSCFLTGTVPYRKKIWASWQIIIV